MTISEPLFKIFFLTTDKEPLFGDDHIECYTQPLIGQGIVGSDGKRYRVVDVWTNFEKHGGGMDCPGVYAFCEPVAVEDDLPLKIWPEWYSKSAAE